MAPGQHVYGEHRFPGPRETHPAFAGGPMEGQHPARFPGGPVDGQQAWIQQQQQRFQMEGMGPRMPGAGPGGEMRYPGPLPFPGAMQSQPGAVAVTSGQSHFESK